jgi:uncharacterized repeat protein (TIGR03943 family)
VVLLLLGGAVLRTSLSDLYLRYVKEGLRPFLVGAGVVLVLAAVMTLWYDLRRQLAGGGDGPGHQAHDPGRHAHGEHGPRVGWLLLLPVLGLLLVAPPALGSFAAGQSGTALGSRQSSDFPPLPSGDPAKITVLDYASRAVFDGGQSLGGRRVQLTGFVMAAPDGSAYLARMVLSCCAADARPIKVGLAGAAPAGLSPDSWLEVVGTYTGRTDTDPVNGERIPFLDVAEWHEIAPPKNQYEG